MLRLRPLPNVSGAGGKDAKSANARSVIAAIGDQLSRGRIPIEFADPTLAGQADRIAGMMTAFEFNGNGQAATVIWADSAANSLAAWRFRGVQPCFVFSIRDGKVELTLAAPTNPAP